MNRGWRLPKSYLTGTFFEFAFPGPKAMSPEPGRSRQRLRSSFYLLRLLSAAIVGVFLLGSLAGGIENIEKGTIVDSVTCLKNNQFRYALYLPSSYTAEKKWPVIIAFDPGAQGRRPVEKFRAAAEAYGYIVAGSLEAKNGPIEPNRQAARAVWNDVRERFSIDPERLYAAGFSGGAEAAALFPYFTQKNMAGLVSCGAGLPPRYEPAQVKPAVYCGVIGNLDFRHWDMSRLEAEFDKAQVIHRILYFDGWHQWPPEEFCREAVEWLELTAMKAGLKEKDPSFLEAVFEKRRKYAENLFESGCFVLSLHEFASLAEDFKDLRDVVGIEEKIAEIKSKERYRQLEKEKRAAEQKELALLPWIQKVFNGIEGARQAQAFPIMGEVRQALNLEALIETAGNTEKIYYAEMAKRVLSQIMIPADQRGFQARDKEDLPLAVFYFELAAAASVFHPRQAGEIYNLACAYAVWDKKKDALKNLKLAVEKGFDDVNLLESDKDLESLRATAQYRALVEELKTKKKGG